MARYACRVRARQIVVVVDVAIGAGSRRHRVRVGQRKPCGRVIELAIGPDHGVVAALARCGEAQLDVVHGGRRGVVVLQMARCAGRRGQVVVVVDVAVEAHTGRVGVCVGERETNGRVVEICRLPSTCRVAGLASLRKTARDVIWIRGALEVFQMAGNASGAAEVVVVIDMAVEADARRIGVRVSQRKAE